MGKIQEFFDKWLPENDKREGFLTHDEYVANPQLFEQVTISDVQAGQQEFNDTDVRSSFVGHVAISEQVGDGAEDQNG